MHQEEYKFESIFDQLKTKLNLTKKQTEKFFNQILINPNLANDITALLKTINENWELCIICRAPKIYKCNYCEDEQRNHHQIMVVEKFLDVLNFEKTHLYNGNYFVLGDLISPKKDKSALKNLIKSWVNLQAHSIKEIIIGLPATLNGEITKQFILSQFGGLNIKITQLARGIPVGGSLEYADEITLRCALKNRTSLN